jgi:His-Xaa-Ser system radical SAM maturase HxsC
MVLDVRRATLGLKELAALPWAGLLVDDDWSTSAPTFSFVGDQELIRPGDVIELEPQLSKVSVRYRRGEIGNVLFATERCNNYCLMCSQPPRDVDDRWRISQMIRLIELIDKDESAIAISGGEPTLLGRGLVDIVRKCAETLATTQVHVLSNGRAFSDRGYAQSFRKVHPAMSWGIPLYGDTYELHDYVVQASGAFAETIRGLYALNEADQTIEVRVVLVKPTVERLEQLVRYLYRNLPFVKHVALMGIEPIGFARANYDSLWVDPVDYSEVLQKSTEFLADRGIGVSLYNLPLCVLPQALWPFSRRSISHWKQDYLPVCAGCAVREKCGGFFGWITPEWTSRGVALLSLEGCHA